MEENKNNDIVLNVDGTANYELNIEGDWSGTCKGIFKFKCFLSPLEQLAASKDYRNLIGSNVELLTDQDKFIGFAISQLKYRVLKAPPFWKTGDVFDGNVDLNILSLILEKAISSELLYKEHLKKCKEDAVATAEAVLKAHQERLNPKKEDTKE